MTQKKNNSADRQLHKHAPSFFSRIRKSALWLLVFPLALGGVVGLSAMQFENHDSDCASCHTQPESVYYQREGSSSPSDLASFHAEKKTRCIDCHSSDGSFGRATAMMLGARDLMAFISRSYPQPAPLTRAISDGNCLKCHGDIAQRQNFNNHFHIFLAKWQSLDPKAATCVDCHQSHSTNGDTSIAFLNREHAASVCESCHNFAGARG
jgi:hypothetical protein